mmetsp:Transcript_116674/g.325129  ORF Transcript_116674/g.325129 Transcript_116674/m.325129 type:complete len:376 (+) Transcript_116674:62-1189(+)
MAAAACKHLLAARIALDPGSSVLSEALAVARAFPGDPAWSVEDRAPNADPLRSGHTPGGMSLAPVNNPPVARGDVNFGFAAVVAVTFATAAIARRKCTWQGRVMRRSSSAGAETAKQVCSLEALAKSTQGRRSWFGIRARALEQDLLEALQAERETNGRLREELASKDAEAAAMASVLSKQLEDLKSRESALIARLQAVEARRAARSRTNTAELQSQEVSEVPQVRQTSRVGEQNAVENEVAQDAALEVVEGVEELYPSAELPPATAEVDPQRSLEAKDSKWTSIIEEQNATLQKVLGVIERLEQQSEELPTRAEAQREEQPKPKQPKPERPKPEQLKQGQVEADAQAAEPARSAAQRRDAKDLVMKGYRNAWGR